MLDVNVGKGLTRHEALTLLQKFGPNRLEEKRKRGIGKIFLDQFKSYVIVVLLIAVAISTLIGHIIDSVVIALVIVLNASIGFSQEYRAEKSLQALKKLIAPSSYVLRDGKKISIPAHEIVPGDVVFLETGDKIPADGFVVNAITLEINEASLTGESVSVAKVPAKHGDGEKMFEENLVYMGTTVTYGKAAMVVTKTGMKTRMGSIAKLVQEENEKTPLQEKIDGLGKKLAILVVFVCAAVFFLGMLRGSDIFDMFIVAVSLAVAAIPEGLPAVVVIVLAFGVQIMAKNNAVVRRLLAVETLGSTTIICSDKTGTLTKNEMIVKKIFSDDRFFEVSGEGYEPSGEFYEGREKIDKSKLGSVPLLLKAATLCNNASLSNDERGWHVVGDPTEGSLLVAAEKIGISRDSLKNYEMLGELIFDPKRKRMAMIYKTLEGDIFAFVKGAVDTTLSLCTSIQNGKKVEKITKRDRELIEEANKDFAKGALRVLAFAYKKIPKNMKEFDIESIEHSLTFLGLVGMTDPPRPEVKDAIEKCSQAGIKVAMITGDHKFTAVAVARELGIYDGGTILTGAEISEMTDEELEKVIDDVVVYARVSPEHKLRIVKTLKKKGHVVAVTGDGVNDAPALKKADIGIAMGLTGTEVTKEASDMVLLDDNFATIVKSVEQGRNLYDNIRKSVKYLISTNLSEVLIIFSAILMGFPLPFVAIQILWINLISDTFPALGLGVDPLDPDVMKRPPRKRGDPVIGKSMLFFILFVALYMSVATLFVFYTELRANGIEKAQTTAFTCLVFLQLFNVFNCRSGTYSVLSARMKRNWWLFAAFALTFLLQIAIVYVPVLQEAFHTTSLNLFDLFEAFLVGLSVVFFVELHKVFIKVQERMKLKK